MALIDALHRANQQRLPMTLARAGLPQLLAQMGRAKSYAKRLLPSFDQFMARVMPDVARADT